MTDHLDQWLTGIAEAITGQPLEVWRGPGGSGYGPSGAHVRLVRKGAGPDTLAEVWDAAGFRDPDAMLDATERLVKMAGIPRQVPPPTQLDRIEAKLDDLLAALRLSEPHGSGDGGGDHVGVPLSDAGLHDPVDDARGAPAAGAE
jgi:hypothetical protein